MTLKPRRTLSVPEREPLAGRAAITTAITAVVHLAVVLGLPISHEAETSIGAAVDAVGVVVLIVWGRAGVTANAKTIARVTTEGTVVAGDAAVRTTGEEIPTTVPDGVVGIAAAVDPSLIAGADVGGGV
jgi:hypothetical protein